MLGGHAGSRPVAEHWCRRGAVVVLAESLQKNGEAFLIVVALALPIA
jgi:hypothetical protein